MQLFLPCESVASATFTTTHDDPSSAEPVDTSVDTIQGGSASTDSMAASAATTTQDAATRAAALFSGAAGIAAEVRPGLEALAASQRSCQLTDVFALSSSTVDVYISARDTSDTFRNYEDRCSKLDSPQVTSGITWRICRFPAPYTLFCQPCENYLLQDE